MLKSLVANRTDEALLLLLSHASAEVVTAVTGALVNMSADGKCRVALLNTASSNAVAALAMILRRISFKDLALSTLICQVGLLPNIALSGIVYGFADVFQVVLPTITDLLLRYKTGIAQLVIATQQQQ